MVGQSISHYKILEKLGEGGMGVVYKAEDTKLDRAVALKFLPTHLLGDVEIKKRFEREAKAAAALHHPNICPVYEINDAEEKSFISMAFIEGDSLDKKIVQGPLKLEEALSIAQQIAEGLEAAHEKGIYHRDIKPENVIVDAKGRVTIMDFGLAQLTEASTLTKSDQTMGTVFYMSPEQTEGSGPDHRTDIWSLGVVLYEMVTGQKPFKGDYDKAVMYSILNEEPEPITGLRTGMPMELEVQIGKCLEKEAANRYHSTAETVIDLRNLAEKLKSGRSSVMSAATSVAMPTVPKSEQSGALKQKLRISWALTAVAFLVAGVLGVQYLRKPTVHVPLRRFDVEPRGWLQPPNPIQNTFAVSPDGRWIAYVGLNPTRRLWVHDLERGESRAFAETDGAVGPFWSPDSSTIGFAAEGELRKVSIEGGAPSRICELPETATGISGCWSPDGGTIVFSEGSRGSLYEAPARGGRAELLLSPEDVEVSSGGAKLLTTPMFLPSQAGSRVVLFGLGDVRNQEFFVQDLETGLRKSLGSGARPWYSSTGHIVFQATPTQHDIWAVPFSLSELKTTGAPFLVAEGAAGPSIADDRTLVYSQSRRSGSQQFIWLDRSGARIRSIGDPQSGIGYGVLSPLDRSIAVVAGDGGNLDIWLQEVAASRRMRLTTTPAREIRPRWSPDAKQLAYTSERNGNYDVFLQQIDGSEQPRAVAATTADERIDDWSRDGRYIVYSVAETATGSDLWYLELHADKKDWSAHSFMTGVESPRSARISPDGRFVVYVLSEAGREELYVTSFPGGGRRWVVSNLGGRWPLWSPNGKELFFVQGGSLFAVSVSTTKDFSVGVPERLFEHPTLNGPGPSAMYDVSADGQRFVLPEVVESDGEPALPSIRIVQNWHEEFRDRE